MVALEGLNQGGRATFYFMKERRGGARGRNRGKDSFTQFSLQRGGRLAALASSRLPVKFLAVRHVR